MADATWLAEAVVEFLKGPLYINPLMSFIDERCMIFTPEEENKLEYTTIHNDFKELVDRLLTDFLEDLGVGAEQFYEIVAAAQDSDQLTNFVVQTILTVDDFLMFKAMMVKRNIDLTNQVLQAYEQLEAQLQAAAAAGAGAAAGGEGEEGVAASAPSITSQAAATSAEEQALKEVMELSSRLHSAWAEEDALQRAMRALQMEDEETALPAAIAASLREMARYDSELADIQQAIALSLALEEERRRLAEQEAAPAAASTTGPLPPVKGAPSSGAAPPPPAAAAPAAASAEVGRTSQRFVPAPIDAPTGSGAGRARGRGAGYKSDGAGVDLEAIRKAAQQAAESQKKLIGKGDVNDEASRWLQEAKKKLVAQKQADREQEIEAYKASAAAGKGKAAGGAGAAASQDEA
ncbi:hypothetical protein Agub_g10615, partial [Astrephomene gubernaculifera]